MNSFNITEATIFVMQTVIPEDFPFSQLKQLANSAYKHAHKNSLPVNMNTRNCLNVFSFVGDYMVVVL